MVIKMIALVAVVLAAVLILAGQCGLLQGKAPGDLGVKDGLFKPPSRSENSVSSQAASHPDHPMQAYAQIAPISYTGDTKLAWTKLQKVLATLPRTSTVSDTGSYLYIQCTTRLLRFTDDVEFLLDEANHVIHVRSASRLGRKDFGVNRARIEQIRSVFNTY